MLDGGMIIWIVMGLAIMLVLFVLMLWLVIKQRNMQYWLRSYFFPKTEQVQKRTSLKKCSQQWNLAEVEEPLDVYIAICDHYEPEWGKPAKSVSTDKVKRWCNEYPQKFSAFEDSEGRSPQHTFFFPQDEYAPEYLDLLAGLCRDGHGDVDIHLHHDNDTAEGLQQKLSQFRDTLFNQHGLLRRDPTTGNVVYGFIHGNWALCNARPDGRWCGVENEISILLETGCYADFTMPSAPSNTQTTTINSLYYATQKTGVKSHNIGELAEVGKDVSAKSLLMVQGPLQLDWNRRKFGIIPRIENGDLTEARPPSWERMQLWLQAKVHVAGAPDKLFIKLHTHGCKDGNIDMLLGEPMQKFHHDLKTHAAQKNGFRYHYVTAWEMAQLVHQTEQRGSSSLQEKTIGEKQ
ncbi:hypothetical protein MNBD_PLANCTO02-3075 [hydrothermal vent metagenome]|uniref:Uncharacterized protein n=1 Tax=hydrothermal vent metagenome TaxID=652676 RepID=A0A3B1DR74_9ZZZZ